MSQNHKHQISFIIPVFNRPDEVEELLESFTTQSASSEKYEIVIVEDGSEIPSKTIVDSYLDRLNIQYFSKPNSGPGQSRNYGCDRATGNYLVFLDSDCVLPEQYVKTLYNNLRDHYADCFGGPDAAHDDFSNLQKAINYSMTSFLTTGGIRGGGEKMDKFYPRSFNMGYSREVYDKTQGFAKMRFGEDIDMSIRILKAGFSTKLYKEAYVFHKRRTSLKKFYKQVYNSGIARINLYKKHPESLKMVHFAPAAFVIGVIALIILSIVLSQYFLWPIMAHAILIFLDATVRTQNPLIGLMAIVTSYVQLCGYGMGFISAFWKRIIKGKGEFSAFTKNFYK